jgi:hypothetical protein
MVELELLQLGERSIAFLGGSEGVLPRFSGGWWLIGAEKRHCDDDDDGCGQQRGQDDLNSHSLPGNYKVSTGHCRRPHGQKGRARRQSQHALQTASQAMPQPRGLNVTSQATSHSSEGLLTAVTQCEAPLLASVRPERD